MTPPPPEGPAAAGLSTGLTTAVRPGAAPSVRQPKNLVAVLLSVVTGMGHFYLDHYVTGAVLLGLFATALNGVFLGFTLQSTSSPLLLRALSIVLLVVVWSFGVWHAYRLSYGTDRKALARARDALLREGLIDYLRDDLEAAARKLERAAALDVDWLDPDPSFHLGVAQARLAERRAARGDDAGARTAQKRAQAAFRQCLARDPRRKWRAEVEDELARMRPRTLTARLRKVGGVLRDALETASGTFVRPLAWTLNDEPSGLGPVPGGDHPTVADERPFAQTRKKRRFSAKYTALPPRAEGLDTRAEPATHRVVPAADPGLATRLDPARPPSDEARPPSDEARLPGPTAGGAEPAPVAATPPAPAAPLPEPPPEAVRSVGRFTRASITARLAEAAAAAGDGTAAPAVPSTELAPPAQDAPAGSPSPAPGSTAAPALAAEGPVGGSTAAPREP